MVFLKIYDIISFSISTTGGAYETDIRKTR